MTGLLDSALAVLAVAMLAAAPAPADGHGKPAGPPPNAATVASTARPEPPPANTRAAASPLPIADPTAGTLGSERAAPSGQLIDAVHEAAVRSGPAGPSLTGLAILLLGGYLLVRHARRVR